MSISSLTSAQTCTENRRYAAGRVKTAGASFQEQLTSAVIQGPEIHLRKPVENTVFSGVCAGQSGTMQEIYAEYTADSTPEDPIVRVSGTSDSGPYDFTCHVNDINPSHASYAELAVLYGHLVKTGAYQSSLLAPHVLPTGLEPGDITERRDYLSAIDRHQYDNHFGGTCKAQASELLALYQPYASGDSSSRSAASLDHSAFMKEDLLSALYGAKLDMLDRMKRSKEETEEREDWERLMKYLDAWIETIRKEADIEKIARAYADLKKSQEDAARNRKDLADQLLERLTERLAN